MVKKILIIGLILIIAVLTISSNTTLATSYTYPRDCCAQNHNGSHIIFIITDKEGESRHAYTEEISEEIKKNEELQYIYASYNDVWKTSFCCNYVSNKDSCFQCISEKIPRIIKKENAIRDSYVRRFFDSLYKIIFLNTFRTYPYVNLSKGLSSCGNGFCEEHELLSNCYNDCKDMETSRYELCSRGGWEEFPTIRIYGTNTFVNSSTMLGPNMTIEPKCGKSIGTDYCFKCYSINEVHEPIFEFKFESTNSQPRSFCKSLVRKYLVDGQNKGCDENKMIYFGNYGYYPYVKEKFDALSRMNVSQNKSFLKYSLNFESS